MTTDIFERARHNMVEYQIRCSKVLDPRTLDLIESMPREDFVPEHVKSIAYMEGHLPLPCGQEMLTPLQEAHILQALQLEGTERVLEIGTGTGFLTAMLAMQAKDVVSCEIHEELAEMARKNLETHGITNATVLHVNAMAPKAMEQKKELKKGSFDVLVVGAALKEIPDHLIGYLKKNAQILAFLGENPVVSLVHIIRRGEVEQRTSILETLLQNMEGLPQKREFHF